MMSSGVWFKFRSGSQRNRHEDCFHRSRCGRFVKFSSFRLQSFRQRAILVLSEAKSKGWEKMANVHGDNVARYWRELKKLRDAVQFSG